MAKTNHHFVPQFYLRNFSSAPGSICLINITKEFAVQFASIRGQCYRKKFYGETDELENVLAAIEDDVAPLIRAVIQGMPVRRHSNAHVLLLNFIALQFLRTRAAAEQAARQASLLSTYLAKCSLGDEGEGKDDLRVITRPGVGLPLSTLSVYIQAIADLDLRILRVACDGRFIASDAPVVAYNQWCEGISYQGVTGAACRGLQLFFPLSPHCMLMLFDERVYSVGGEKAREITINRPRDVHKINHLQCVFAQENIFFSEWNDRHQLINLVPRITEIRSQHKPKLHVAAAETIDPESGTASELVHQYVQMPNVHLKLKFSELHRRAQDVPLHDRPRLYRHNHVFPDPDAMPKPSGIKQNERFRLRSVEEWRANWGNVIP